MQVILEGLNNRFNIIFWKCERKKSLKTHYRTDGKGFSEAKMTAKIDGKEYRIDEQREILSSMDVYELCRYYNCSKCAGETISSKDLNEEVE